MEQMGHLMLWAVIVLLSSAVVVWLLAKLVRQLKLLFTTVFEWEYGLSYVDGAFEGILAPGRHWNPLLHRRDIFRLRKGHQVLKTPLLDVTSGDRLFFRLSATISYSFADPRIAFENRHEEKLQLAAASAMIKVAGGRTLEALLQDRGGLDAAILSAMPSPIAGCQITGVNVDSVALPPELRRLFSEAERARIEGTAALERARGEHASLRSLANAARMLKGNPELMNLRVLQALSNPGKGQPTLVLGQNGLIPIASGTSPSQGEQG